MEEQLKEELEEQEKVLEEKPIEEPKKQQVKELTSTETKRLNKLVSEVEEWFEDDHKKITTFARSLPILVLGDHPEDGEEINVSEEVIKKLREKYHFAINLKEVSKKGNHLHSEKRAIEQYPVVIKLENRQIGKPGAIGECVLITCDKKSQEKTFLFVKEDPQILKKVFSIEHYFLYFPRIYFCKDDSDMIDKATKIAIRETYRLVYMSSNRNNK